LLRERSLFAANISLFCLLGNPPAIPYIGWRPESPDGLFPTKFLYFPGNQGI
jgi:hypothetical protein